MRNKILVTGVSGFVGRTVFSYLGEVCVPVYRASNHSDRKNSFVIERLDGETNWKGAFDDVDVVVHLAALAHSKHSTLKNYHEVNVLGTLRLASEAVKSGVRRFIFVSSIGVNGGGSEHGVPFSPYQAVEPHNLYSRSKSEAELGLKKISAETGLEVVIVRPTLVYGNFAPGNFGQLTKLINMCPMLPFGLAKNRRDFIAVQNLADLLITCANHPDAAGHTFLASDGETVSIKQFTNAIAEGLGKKIIQLPIPVSLMRLAGKLTGKSNMIEQLYGNLVVDSSNVKEVLGWTPPLTMKQAMATLCDSGVKSK